MYDRHENSKVGYVAIVSASDNLPLVRVAIQMTAPKKAHVKATLLKDGLTLLDEEVGC